MPYAILVLDSDYQHQDSERNGCLDFRMEDEECLKRVANIRTFLYRRRLQLLDKTYRESGHSPLIDACHLSYQSQIRQTRLAMGQATPDLLVEQKAEQRDQENRPDHESHRCQSHHWNQTKAVAERKSHLRHSSRVEKYNVMNPDLELKIGDLQRMTQ